MTNFNVIIERTQDNSSSLNKVVAQMGHVALLGSAYQLMPLSLALATVFSLSSDELNYESTITLLVEYCMTAS